MNKECEIVLKYINNEYKAGRNPTFEKISRKFDYQYQDLKIIIDYLIENNYYIIFDKKNTDINWEKYNGVPSIKGRDYFKNTKKSSIKNFFKYIIINLAIPTIVAVISSLIATNMQNDKCCDNANQYTCNNVQNNS